MIIIWRGYGGLVPAVIVISAFFVFMGIFLMTGDLQHAQSHAWPLGVIFILSAIVCSKLNRWLRSRGSLLPFATSMPDPNDPRNPRKGIYISERWGENQRPRDIDTGTCFFIPIRGWVWILSMLGCTLIIGELIENQRGPRDPAPTRGVDNPIKIQNPSSQP